MKLDPDDLTLLDLDEQPWNEHLRDPGLHPRFQMFVSNWMAGYLCMAPGRINALLSGYSLVHRPHDLQRAKQSVACARELFLDSGVITTLLMIPKGKGTGAEVREWLRCTDQLVAMAHTMVEHGAPPGVIAAMDLPAYSELLALAGITVAEGAHLTLENAVDMMGRTLPDGWKPVFTSQGVSLEDHLACMTSYEDVGLLDMVRDGAAWLAVGGMAFESSTDRVHVVHRAIRERLGQGHIHALGVSRTEVLVPMIRHGWVNSADSSSPCQMIRYNRGPYRVEGPRPEFLVTALHAASALYQEADLAMQLTRAERQPLHAQEVLFDAV